MNEAKMREQVIYLLTHFDGWIIILGGFTILFISFYFLSWPALSLLEKIFPNLKRSLEGRGTLHKTIGNYLALFISMLLSISLITAVPENALPGKGQILSAAKALVVFFGALLAARAVTVFTWYLFDRFDVTVADNLRQRRLITQIQFVRKIALIILWVMAVGLILLSFDNLRHLGGSLLASAGVLSVIIGFAAQKSIGNLIAGFQIAFTQPLRIGDAVTIEDEFGWVEEITLTYAVVRIWDFRRLIIPITRLVEEPFRNWTWKTAQTMGDLFIYLDYQADIDELRKKYDELVASHPLWDGMVKVLQVVDLTEHTVKIRGLVSAKDPGEAFQLRCDLREGLIAYLKSQQPEALPRIRLEPEDEISLKKSSRAGPPRRDVLHT